MSNVTSWDKLAYLYHISEVELAEMIKTFFILSKLGFFDNDIEDAYVLDNAELNNAFILHLIGVSGDKPIAYTEMADILGYNVKTVNSIVARLLKRGMVEKLESSRAGTIYAISPDVPPIPKWIQNIADSLIRMHRDHDLKYAVMGECRGISFKQGFEAMQDELREKYYRPRKRTDE
jgi:predicted DNA-binding transcriptional regulator